MTNKEFIFLFVITFLIGFAFGQLFSWYEMNKPLYMRIDGIAFKPMVANNGTSDEAYLGIKIALE